MSAWSLFWRAGSLESLSVGLFVFSHALQSQSPSLWTLTDAQGLLGLWELAGPKRDNFMGNLCPLLLPSQSSTDQSVL